MGWWYATFCQKVLYLSYMSGILVLTPPPARATISMLFVGPNIFSFQQSFMYTHLEYNTRQPLPLSKWVYKVKQQSWYYTIHIALQKPILECKHVLILVALWCYYVLIRLLRK